MALAKPLCFEPLLASNLSVKVPFIGQEKILQTGRLSGEHALALPTYPKDEKFFLNSQLKKI
jgi:hypothetical protein